MIENCSMSNAPPLVAARAGRRKQGGLISGGYAFRKCGRTPAFSRPFGTWISLRLQPNAEALGYSHEVHPGQRGKSNWCGWLLLLLILSVSCSVRADEFDSLRLKWLNLLTFGTNATKTDTNYYAWVSQIESNAQSFSSSMVTSPSRTFLWSAYNKPASDSGDISGTYSRLRAMALGYAAQGSSNYANPFLRTNIISGLDWMFTNYYNASVTNEYDNWFDWEIATPLNLNDTAVLIYNDLSTAQRSNYLSAIDYFTPDALQIQMHTTNGPSPATAANKVWKASVLAVSALIMTNSAKLLAATQALSDVFPYVTNGDGFYPDGSFVFHSNAQGIGGFAYNGGYGAQLLATIGPLMQLLNNSTWQITDPARTNVFRWVYDSFEPFIYRGALMELVSGRYYTRDGDSHLDADDVLQGIISLAQVAPPADVAAYKSIMKYWIQSDSYRNFVQNQPPPFNVWAVGVLHDPAVVPASEPVRSGQFSHMDVALHLRPGWGFGISMSSSRGGNYESIQGENLHGWYTGDGMTYLYNADLAQYADNYWSTVNPYRMPGTTVDSLETRTNSSGEGYRSPNNWVGGASLQNLYGVSGMQLSGWNNSVTAKKSWFMFDDEVVCLGAGVTGTGAVETIVENRRLSAYGDNIFTVNGVPTPPSVGWVQTLPNASWAHLIGNLPGADVGYFFPQSPTLKVLREPRTGSFSSINTPYGATNQSTRNFFTLWFDHGSSPANATYAYVLLPNQTPAQVAAYAANPDITILANSSSVQAVQENTLSIIAANFWTSGSIAGITVDKKASVMVRNDGTFIDVAISDPTQVNPGFITNELTTATAALKLWADTNITVLQTFPTIKLAVNVKNAGGQTFHARFLGQTMILTNAADAYVESGTNASSNFGTNASLILKSNASSTNQNREAYLRFVLPPGLAPGFNATLQLTPLNSRANVLTNAIAFVPDNSWSETGITWNNKPASTGASTNWLVPTSNSPILIDISPIAQQALTNGGVLSLRIFPVGASPTSVSYASREANNSTVPQLVLISTQAPPTIAFTSPADGASFDAPASLTLAVMAQDSDGSVASVDFYNGTVKIGHSNLAQSSLPLSNLGAGKYTFTAVATDNSGLQSVSAPVSISVYNPEPAGSGTGLWAELYIHENFSNLLSPSGGGIHVDPTVDFDWGQGSPGGLPTDHFSVRWTGKLQARHAGVHVFDVIADDGARLWVNGQLIIDNFLTNNTASETTGAISLLPGQYYDIMLEYFEDTGNASVKLYWTEPGGTKAIIPQSQLYPADTGLRGQYYSGTNFNTYAFSRIDKAINFNWTNSSPDSTLLPGAFSVRWIGKLRANQGGTYTFSTTNADGVRLTVGNQLVINNWSVGATQNSGTVILSANQFTTITQEFFHASSASPATVVLFWTPPGGGTQQVIPTANLTPHTNNNPPSLAFIPNNAVIRGSNLSFTATATDPDTGQALSFSLDPGAPIGTTINSATGLFSWTPTQGLPLGDYQVTVRVKDNGAPPMTDAQTVTITVTTNRTAAMVAIVPAGGQWRYLDTGLDAGTAWRANNFNDSSWSAGWAPLGYGTLAVFTTVNYGPDPNNKHTTTYFRHAFYVPDASLVESLSAHLLCDDGAVVYLNGVEIWRANVPAGQILYNTLAVSEAGPSPGYITQALSPSSLITGTNVIAVEIHQAASNGPDILFDLELTGLAVVPSGAALSISLSGPGPVLCWPLDASLFQLYSTTNLDFPITWFPATNLPFRTNNLWCIPLSSSTNQFFRLQTR